MLKTLFNISDLKINNYHATRITKDSETQIDLVASNIEDIIVNSDDSHKISDHDTLLCTVSTKIKHTKHKKPNNFNEIKTIKMYKNIDYNILNNVISQELESTINEETDLHNIASKMIAIIHNSIEKVVPTREIKMSGKTFNKKWLNQKEVKSHKNKVTFLWKKYKYNKDNDMKQTLWQEYTTARNQYLQVLRQHKSFFLKTTLICVKVIQKKCGEH